MTAARPYELAPLEIASGLILGLSTEYAALAGDEPPGDPRQALERAILPALQRAPCLVSFSGGRDSSAVLAVAAHVARREGLPLPIPSTNRFPAAADTDESDWQERVVAHLGLDDWMKLEFTDELDCVGSIAAGVLRRHGLLWPFNAHFHAPQLEAAAGGSVLTGIGGDEALDSSSWERARAVLSGRARPRPRDVLRVGFHAAPASLRRSVLRRRFPLQYAWLKPEAQRVLAADWAANAASEPLAWEAHMTWRRRLRYLHVGLSSLALLADDASARIVHPFADAGFSAALARLPKPQRFADRTAAMRLLVGDLLPDEVVARTTKSIFDQAFWNKPSKAFAAAWGQEGVDLSLVDLDALRREWKSAEPDARSFTQLQAAWLAGGAASNGSSGAGAVAALGRLH